LTRPPAVITAPAAPPRAPRLRRDRLARPDSSDS
jgi:hypothetical protein